MLINCDRIYTFSCRKGTRLPQHTRRTVTAQSIDKSISWIFNCRHGWPPSQSENATGTRSGCCCRYIICIIDRNGSSLACITHEERFSSQLLALIRCARRLQAEGCREGPGCSGQVRNRMLESRIPEPKGMHALVSRDLSSDAVLSSLVGVVKDIH